MEIIHLHEWINSTKHGFDHIVLLLARQCGKPPAADDAGLPADELAVAGQRFLAIAALYEARHGPIGHRLAAKMLVPSLGFALEAICLTIAFASLISDCE